MVLSVTTRRWECWSWLSKIKSLKFATEATITILHIDDMTKLTPERSEEGSHGDAVAKGEL